MLTSQEINAIGQILNDTWGEWSTKVSPSMSIRGIMSGKVLNVQYTTIVTLPEGYHDREQLDRHADESVKLTDDFMKKCRADFKESAGRTLKVKQLGTNDSLEMITASPFSPKRIAYYRRVTTFDVT
jgi:hypothetical protein|tara:strand:+ start:224 stop:604 length:381 start_codon:yes stop_codon:yes gene_type:complete